MRRLHRQVEDVPVRAVPPVGRITEAELLHNEALADRVVCGTGELRGGDRMRRRQSLPVTTVEPPRLDAGGLASRWPREQQQLAMTRVRIHGAEVAPKVLDCRSMRGVYLRPVAPVPRPCVVEVGGSFLVLAAGRYGRARRGAVRAAEEDHARGSRVVGHVRELSRRGRRRRVLPSPDGAVPGPRLVQQSGPRGPAEHHDRAVRGVVSGRRVGPSLRHAGRAGVVDGPIRLAGARHRPKRCGCEPSAHMDPTTHRRPG